MGYHEYFQLARDINAVPVAVVGAGVACQTNGRYEAYLQAMNKTYMTDEQWETYLVDECGYKKSEVAQRTQYIDSLGVKNADDFDAFVDSMSLNPDTAEFTNYAQDVLDLIEQAIGRRFAVPTAASNRLTLNIFRLAGIITVMYIGVILRH